MKHVLFFTISLLLGFSTFASTGEPENVLVIKAEPKAIYEGSSEHHRMDKQYVLTGETGFSVGAIPSGGANAGYYLDRNSVVQASYAGGSLKLIDFSLRTKTGSVLYKRFLGNSFYFRAGPGYREIELQYDNWLNSTFLKSNGYKDVGVSRSLVADVAIGNQWQWENFTLGCDWIGAMVPVADLGSRINTDGLSDADKRDVNDQWDKLQKITSLQAIRFYIGASF
jgi:hypothetical protein